MTVSSFGVIIIVTLIWPFNKTQHVLCKTSSSSNILRWNCEERLPLLTLRGAYWPSIHGTPAGWHYYDLPKSRSQKTVHEVGVASTHIMMICICLISPVFSLGRTSSIPTLVLAIRRCHFVSILSRMFQSVHRPAVITYVWVTFSC